MLDLLGKMDKTVLEIGLRATSPTFGAIRLGPSQTQGLAHGGATEKGRVEWPRACRGASNGASRLYSSAAQQPALRGVNRRSCPPLRRAPSWVWLQNNRALSASGTCIFRTSSRSLLGPQTRTPTQGLVQSQEARLDQRKFRAVKATGPMPLNSTARTTRQNSHSQMRLKPDWFLDQRANYSRRGDEQRPADARTLTFPLNR